ncbi:Mitochondrial translocator assembly and maintenance protein 41 [Chytriomyces hyalinus]|nr:Mitochondrial translocator assembly and maintenance protein 41 [Chytriomyces hyalinus]
MFQLNLITRRNSATTTRCVRTINLVRGDASKAATQDAHKHSSDVWASEHLQHILQHFDAPIRFAAGYGSGVLKQDGYGIKPNVKPPMVDLIFGVTHPEHWHSLNLRQNPSHYSFVSALGAKSVTALQEKWGASMYFNPDVLIGEQRIKYGVISMKHLIQDLNEWNNFYVAGRFQKPIRILRGDSRVKLSNDENLANAVRVALLLLPPQFSEYQLYTTIVGLSYLGDFRMIFGENPKKVENIVNAQVGHLRVLYKSVLADLSEHFVAVESVAVPATAAGEEVQALDAQKVMFSQNMDVKLRGSLLFELPKSVRDKVLAAFHKKSRMDTVVSALDLSQKAAASDSIQSMVKQAIAQTVRGPALTQSLKGLITAGPTKSLRYIGEKLSKR